MRVQAPVARLSETPGTVKHLGRSIGADNQQVFSELLNLNSEELARLAAAGII
jgi:crotonobetainyl-CoA:carnitine CoA-transferase CaiB-like acyl-CoA transferase